MKQSQLLYWEKTRAQGKRAYILKNGMLYFGLPLGILSAFMNRFLENSYSFDGYFNGELLGEMIARGLFFFLITGPLFGLITWHLNEKNYKKTIEKGVNDL